MKVPCLTKNIVFYISFLIRIILIVFGEYQDNNFIVKYTDVDYHVFTDAAKHVSEGNSPFERHTYRYTPLVALLLLGNIYLAFIFGKFVFIICDVITGWMIYSILILKHVKRNIALKCTVLWLFNPISLTISSRGNAESLMTLLVLCFLYFIFLKKIKLSAFFYAISVHFKIYSIIYALPIYLYLNFKYNGQNIKLTSMRHFFVSLWPNLALIQFIFISIVTFSILMTWMYIMYGFRFFEEAYLYHIMRQDIHHNFSLHFYMMYLLKGNIASAIIAVACFLPQLILLLVVSFKYYQDLVMCCFMQTFIFVTFNKVCTSQYFIWYLCLLPIIVPFLQINFKEGLYLVTAWFTGQALWLIMAYFLEFKGENVYIFVWLASLLFFIVNVYILNYLIMSHNKSNILKKS